MNPVIIESWTVHGIDWAIAASGNPKRMHFTPTAFLDGKDYKRSEDLGFAERGSGHDCYLKGITVNVDMFTTQNIHRQLLRYGHIEVVSSMSLEHEWEEILGSDFHMQNVDKFIRDNLRRYMDVHADRMWFLHNMPMGVLLGMSIRTNYLQLKTIHAQRKAHRNPGWKVICDWIEELPRFKQLVLGE